MRVLVSRFTIAVLVLVLVFTALPAIDNVLAACSGTGCRGKDPIVEGCTNVSTYAYAYYPVPPATWIIQTELRRSSSASCNSFWSRATKSSGYTGNIMLSEALECANNDCIYTSTTPPPNPSTYYYYYPWSGNKQTANPDPASLGYFYSDMVSGTKNVCARGWVYHSEIANYVTSSSVYRSWACNNSGGPG